MKEREREWEREGYIERANIAVFFISVSDRSVLAYESNNGGTNGKQTYLAVTSRRKRHVFGTLLFYRCRFLLFCRGGLHSQHSVVIFARWISQTFFFFKRILVYLLLPLVRAYVFTRPNRKSRVRACPIPQTHLNISVTRYAALMRQRINPIGAGPGVLIAFRDNIAA